MTSCGNGQFALVELFNSYRVVTVAPCPGTGSRRNHEAIGGSSSDELILTRTILDDLTAAAAQFRQPNPDVATRVPLMQAAG